MGKEKTTVTNDAQQTKTATAEETELNRLQLEQAKAFDPIQRQLNEQGGNLVLKLLQGQDLPGYLGKLPGGIDEGVTGSIVQDSIKDLQPTFGSNGLLDSGVNASISARTAADVRQNAAQFNIGNLLNLLNLGVGHAAQIQQPALSTSQMLGQRLAGLGTTRYTGTQTTLGMNPFTKSLQQSAGTSLGNGTFGNNGGWWSK